MSERLEMEAGRVPAEAAATDEVLALAMELVARRSVTPDDAGCQQVLAGRLRRAGFETESMRFGEVDNLWACHGRGSPLLVLLGHTDVVPPGPAEAWRHDPFAPRLEDGWLYGRGAADMKSSVAAFVVAAERFVQHRPAHRGSLALLLTSDEEGTAQDGTVRVVKVLGDRGLHVDYCLVGEPSSGERLGDVIKHGRRGSLGARVLVHGVQGHVAYPQLARNPVHEWAAAAAELAATRWDDGNAHFPPTSFQITDVSAGTGADNVIPGHVEARFNFRFSTEQSEASLRERVESILARHCRRFTIDWRLSGQPFLTAGGALLEAVRESVREVTGADPVLSTSGGTSDGRFLAPTGAEVVELGPCNATIHQANERIAAPDPARLSRVYSRVIERLLRESD